MAVHMLPFIKRTRELHQRNCSDSWNAEVLCISSSLLLRRRYRPARMHPPIPVTSPRGTNTGQQRARARYDYVTRSVQQPLEPESSSYSFFFRVLQFLFKFIREFRRDETRLFSNEPLLPRLPIADSKIDPPLPGEIRIRASETASWMKMKEGERLQLFSLLWDQNETLIIERNLKLISFFRSYSFNQS